MGKIKDFFRNIFSYRIRSIYYNKTAPFFRNTKPASYAKCGKHVSLNCPLYLNGQNVELDDFTRLQPGIRVISSSGKLIVKKFSAIGAQCVIVPGSHVPTVGLPQYLSYLYLNDKDSVIVVEEDCWVGAGSYLLSHCSIGRGAVVAAGSIVTKTVPPYAVVAGSPAKVIATRFTVEQILAHERVLYPEEERFQETYLRKLFNEQYSGLKSIGSDQLDAVKQGILNKEKERLNIPVYE